MGGKPVDRTESGRTFAERPRDPRSRDVIERAPHGTAGIVSLHLDCGHWVHRRFDLCEASRIICSKC